MVLIKQYKLSYFCKRFNKEWVWFRKLNTWVFSKDKKHSITKYAPSLIVKMVHDKDMQAKLEEYIIKSKKVEIKKRQNMKQYNSQNI